MTVADEFRHDRPKKGTIEMRLTTGAGDLKPLNGRSLVETATEVLCQTGGLARRFVTLNFVRDYEKAVPKSGRASVFAQAADPINQVHPKRATAWDATRGEGE